MVPSTSMLAASRLVRQTAKDQAKLAELSIVGSGDLDRQVLEKMLPPFEHMLRNAVIHGLESPPEREVMGKPPSGSIRIVIRREGAEVVIDIADDGRGLDVLAIRRKAVELGFVSREATLMTRRQCSSSCAPGQHGRPAYPGRRPRHRHGLVANQVAKLGGTLSIASTGVRALPLPCAYPLRWR